MSRTTEILPLRCGTLRAPGKMLERGAQGDFTLPVYAFLIRHASGRAVVFDAGLSPSDHGQVLFDAFHNELPPGHDIAARVAAAGVEPSRIEALVVSHSHYDHVGGASLLPNARVIIHRREELRTLDAGRDLLLVDETHDVFGDGSVEVFATPGHTCGHQSVRVFREGGADVLAGDACYFCRSLDHEEVDQPFPFDKAQWRPSAAWRRCGRRATL